MPLKHDFKEHTHYINYQFSYFINLNISKIYNHLCKYQHCLVPYIYVFFCVLFELQLFKRYKISIVRQFRKRIENHPSKMAL